MADISITAANVKAPSGAENIRSGTAGATITRGQLLYIDTADSDKLKLADADAEASAVIAGVALTPASADEPVVYANGGDYECGGTVVKGAPYYASGTAGGLQSALVSGDYTSILGVASSTTAITINIYNSAITTT